jgi:ribonucleoside-diphosphate reductase beta chain
VFKPTEIKMMLTAFQHGNDAYRGVHTCSTPSACPKASMACSSNMTRCAPSTTICTFGVENDEDIAHPRDVRRLHRSLQLASFAMLMNFPRFNKMKGMGQIVSWSIRDESLHCEGIIKLFHTFTKERDA